MEQMSRLLAIYESESVNGDEFTKLELELSQLDLKGFCTVTINKILNCSSTTF